MELVIDPVSRTPATEQAKEICEILKENGVFNYPTGKYDNVLKIKPPIVFNQRNVDYFVAQLSAAFKQL
jgi:4-aminobutyrate aminotransferase-like enzyme